MCSCVDAAFIRTYGHSHTKGCLPSRFVDVRTDRLTQLKETEAPHE